MKKPTIAQRRAHYKKLIKYYEDCLKEMKQHHLSTTSARCIAICINIAAYTVGWSRCPWSFFNEDLFNYYPELAKVKDPSGYGSNEIGIKFRIKILEQALKLATPKPK